MKKRKMLDILAKADDSYIAEADPSSENVALKKRKSFSVSTIIACACCMLLVLNLLIFVPFLMNDANTIDSGTDNSINHTQNPPPSTEGEGNNGLIVNENILGILDKLYGSYNGATGDGFSDLNDALEKEEQEDGIQEESKEENSNSDSFDKDINDNQVDGVSESDVIKRSDKHIFYLSSGELSIYSIDKENSKLVCKLSLKGYIEDLEKLAGELNNSSTKTEDEELKEEIDEGVLDKIEILETVKISCSWEMYLNQDCKALTIIVAPKFLPLTAIFTIDISRMPSVDIIDYKIYSGSYISSRMVGKELILFTRYNVKKNYSRELPTSYMPFFRQDSKDHIVEDLYYPQAVSSSAYMVVTRIGTENGRVLDSSAFLGYSDILYVSQSNIYLTRYRTKNTGTTEIVRVDYSTSNFKVCGITTILGQLKDQYSLDEYQGTLRVVATVYGKYDENGKLVTTRSNASLYCIDINSMKCIAKVEHFAPYGEIVRSSRFDKETAYVCTSFLQTDPVFFFDLSDLNNITYTDTGIIDGYSSSLINLENGYALGIGYGEKTSTLKIEVYKRDGDKVVSVAVYESLATTFSQNYKAYYVNRELNLVGLGTTVKGEKKYLLLYFNGSELIPIINDAIDYSYVSYARGFYEDSYYYLISDNDFKVINIGDMEKTNAQNN